MAAERTWYYEIDKEHSKKGALRFTGKAQSTPFPGEEGKDWVAAESRHPVNARTQIGTLKDNRVQFSPLPEDQVKRQTLDEVIAASPNGVKESLETLRPHIESQGSTISDENEREVLRETFKILMHLLGVK